MQIRHLYPRGSRALSSALGMVAIIFMWIIFAPTQVGGLASYVIVIGSSMEPNFHIGDMIVAHQQPVYKTGDAVVYRNNEMQEFVFHRIIAEDLGRYTLQGDNNPWVDTYQPTREEIIGKLWLHIPHGGIAMQKIRSPWMLALIAAGAGAFFSTSLFSGKTKGNKHMSNKSLQEWFTTTKGKARSWLATINTTTSSDPVGSGNGNFLEGSFFVLGAVLLFSFVIGIISFSRPVERIVSDDIQYQHLAIFSYLASAPEGIYDSNAIKSGDPIFPRLTCAVDVNLQYTLIAQDAKRLTGTYQLTAVVQDQISGWQRTIALQEETAFTGNSFGTMATLDLCQIEQLTQSMESETDFHPGSYLLTVVPYIHISGDVSGHELDGTFNSGLSFLYDRVHFYLQQTKDVESPLSLMATGTIKAVRNEPNPVVFLGREISVLLLRWIAVLGLLVSLAGLLFIGLRLQALSNSDRVRFLRLKYDSLIVDVTNTYLIDSRDSVDVTSMDALAKLAERLNAVILHVESDHVHHYIVQAGGSCYQFRLNHNGTDSAIPAHEAPAEEAQA